MLAHSNDLAARARRVHAHPEVIAAFVDAVTARHRTLRQTYPGRFTP